uniref:Serine/arginine repetitive matrix protein 1-like n=1 Tax=Macrostomum lignano TaxID=282301 RepID=A0A1I8F958_9PLAT
RREFAAAATAAASGQRQSSSPRSTTPADVSRSCWPLWPMAPTRARTTPRRGLSYQLSHPALLTKHRVRPLKPPAAAPRRDSGLAADRPRPRRRPTVPLSDLPRRSGSDNDSDDGERAEAPRMMQRRLRQFEPSQINYTSADQPVAPTSSLSRRSNQTPIVESADLRSRRRERGSASPRSPAAFPASPPPALPPPPPPRRHHSHQAPLLRRLWFHSSGLGRHHRGSATEKPQAAVKSPTPLADSKRTTRCPDASKATTETKEQQPLQPTATQLQKGS